MRTIRLGERVFVFTLGGDTIETSWGANCVAVVGRDAVLLVDSLIAPAHARRVESALREVTRLPVRFVVLTHHHTDHALGAGYFAAKGAAVIAHRLCRDRMLAEHPGLVASRRLEPKTAELFRDAEPYVPQLAFETTLSIDLGGLQARVFHPGHQHTPGDAVIHIARESLVVCGDLVSAGYHVNYEDAAPSKLDAGLSLLRDLDARTYVPGHGPPGGRDLLDGQARYHAAVGSAGSAEADPDRAVEAMRLRYPGHLLQEVLPGSVAALRASALRSRAG